MKPRISRLLRGVGLAVAIIAPTHAKPVSLLDPSFDAGTGPNGTVARVALQSDGKILITGGFTKVADAAREGIARLNADGSLDTAFHPQIENTGISDLTVFGVQADGKILVLGNFKAIGGVGRNGVARLRADGSLDESFVPPPGDWAKGTLQTDGKIVLLSYGHPDPSRNVVDDDLIRINPDATPDPSFKRSKLTVTGSGFNIDKLVSQPDGKILLLLSHSFIPGPNNTIIEGVSRRLIARLNSDGSLDAAFDPGAKFAGANANDPVGISAVLVQSDGKIVVSGYFQSFDGNARDSLLRLNADGSLDPGFVYVGPSLGQIWTMALDADGKILVGGSGTIGSGNIIRLNPNASVDERFYSSALDFMDYILSIAVQSDGKVVIGGAADTFSAVRRNRVARLFPENPGGSSFEFTVSSMTTTEGSGDVTLTIERSGDVSSAATVDYVATDGTATTTQDFAGGQGTISFSPLETLRIFQIAVIDDGLAEPDETFFVTLTHPTGGATVGPQKSVTVTILDNDRPGAFDTGFGGCDCSYGLLSPLSDGKILVLNGNVRRFNSDGTSDSTFVSGLSPVASLAVQSDGRIVVGGSFPKGIARLTPDGSVDPSFDAGVGVSPASFDSCGCDPFFGDSAVVAIAIQPDAKILVAGGFTQVSGVPRPGLARLDADGLLDETFNARIDASYACARSVYAVALQSDGKILISGTFTNVGGVPRNGLARLEPNGDLDADFVPAIGFPTVVSESGRLEVAVRLLQIQPDGKALAAFSGSGNGVADQYTLDRFNPDGSLDAAFNAHVGVADDQCYIPIAAALVQADNRILIGGAFDTVNGKPRPRLALLHEDGSLDTSFDVPIPPNSGSYSPIMALQGLRALAIQADGQILAASHYAIIRLNGYSRRLEFGSRSYSASERDGAAQVTVRRRGDTSVAASVDYQTEAGTAASGQSYIPQSATLSFAPSETVKIITIPTPNNGRVEQDRTFRLTLQNPSSGSILGLLTNTEVTILDDERPGSLDPEFPLRPEFNNLNAAVSSAALQPDGSMVVVVWTGDFAYGPTTEIFHLNPDGSVRRSFLINADVRSAALQPDGKIFIGGFFEIVNNVPRHLLARLNTDGSVDPSYNPGATVNIGYGVLALRLDSVGRLLVGGFATSEKGGLMLARFTPNGDLDKLFNPRLSAPSTGGTGVASIEVQADGKILLTGQFVAVEGLERRGIARLNADGSLDKGFEPALPNFGVVAAQPDGKIIIGGSYGTLAVAQLNADGSVVRDFKPVLSTGDEFPPVSAVLAQPDGKVLIEGAFTAVNGLARNGVVRLNSDGSVDASFTAFAGVHLLGLQADGKVLATYTRPVNGVTQTTLVRLNGDNRYIKLLSLSRAPDGPFRISFKAQPGNSYILQSSANLVDWRSIQTNTAATMTLQLEDPDLGAQPYRYYRAALIEP